MDAAALGLIGALAGTALGSAAAYVTQRAQWRREHSHQWDERRQSLYADYLAACDKLSVDTQLTRRHVTGVSQTSDDLVEALTDDVWPLRTRLELIASPVVAKAADLLDKRLLAAANDPEGTDPGPYAAAREFLLAAMRRELEVS